MMLQSTSWMDLVVECFGSVMRPHDTRKVENYYKAIHVIQHIVLRY